MKVGNLVRIKRGDYRGELALVTKVAKLYPRVVHCLHSWNPSQDRFGYYGEDLEVIGDNK
jgi:hypothetical protein